MMGRAIFILAISATAAFNTFAAEGGGSETFSPYVDEAGSIKVPTD